MAKRVLIINPPLFLGKSHIDYPQFYSLGIVSNAATLRENGFNISVADAFSRVASRAIREDGDLKIGAPMADLLESEGTTAPDTVIVAVSPFLFPHVRNEHCAGVLDSARAAFPDARIIAADCYFSGMHYIEYDGREFLAAYPSVDAVVKYESEARLSDVVSESGKHAAAVSKCDALEVVLDDLPTPAWDLVSVEDYYSFQAKFRRELSSTTKAASFRSLPAVTSRGCPYKCVFCTSNPGQRTRRFRANSPEYIERMLSEYLRKHNAQNVVFLDSIPNLDPDRFLEILKIVKSLKLTCEFPNGLRADHLRLDHLALLKTISGGVKVSAESGSERILTNLQKGLSFESVEVVAGWCRDMNIPLGVHYIIGLPFENPEDANKTLESALKLKETYGAVPLVQFLSPLQGTVIHRRASGFGMLNNFDPFSVYSYFTKTPAFDRPDFPAAKLSGLMRCFKKRLSDSGTNRVIMNLTYMCPNDCVFCAVGDRERAHGDAARFAKFLREYRDMGVESVDFDGGEPTLFPRFMRLVALARELGYNNINVTTNARSLADRGAASRFLLSGLTSVLVSVHGHTAELHERHTRSKRSFEETVRGIKHIVELKPARVGFAINTTVTKWNAPCLDDMLGFFKGLGAGAVNIQFITPHGHARAFYNYDVEALSGKVLPVVRKWSAELPLNLINLQPCLSRAITGELDPETGKYARDMVFADSPPMNLGKYLDQRRSRLPQCVSCEAAIACAGFYVFEGGNRE